MGDLPKINYIKKRWQKFVVCVFAAFLKMYCATLRVKLSPETTAVIDGIKPPLIFAFWHNKLFVSCMMSGLLPHGSKIYGLVSPSKDGAWLAYLFKKFGIFCVRGSSRRRGLSAISKMADILSNGSFVAITPDGPRGPVYRMKNGLVMAAKKSSCNVVLVKVKYGLKFKLPTWDSFEIPLPFTTVSLDCKMFKYCEFKDFDIACATKLLEGALND